MEYGQPTRDHVLGGKLCPWPLPLEISLAWSCTGLVPSAAASMGSWVQQSSLQKAVGPQSSQTSGSYRFLKYIFIFIHVCPCIPHVFRHLQRPDGTESSRIIATWRQEAWVPYGCWEQNLGALEEQQVLYINHWATCLSIYSLVAPSSMMPHEPWERGRLSTPWKYKIMFWNAYYSLWELYTHRPKKKKKQNQKTFTMISFLTKAIDSSFLSSQNHMLASWWNFNFRIRDPGLRLLSLCISSLFLLYPVHRRTHRMYREQGESDKWVHTQWLTKAASLGLLPLINFVFKDLFTGLVLNACACQCLSSYGSGITGSC